MIILTEKLPDLQTSPSDAPPSYNRLDSGSASGSSIRSQNRQPPPKHPQRPIPSPSSSHSSSSSPTFASLIEAKLESQKSKFKSSLIELLGGGTGQTTKDVKNMAYRSIRDVVKHPGAQQSTALIETCAEMCRTKGVNFAEVLQDPVLEGHRALYWVIISNPPPDQYELLSTILKHSGTLCSEAVDEVRLACVQVGDQSLFSHLWKHPAYGALSGTDELLLGATFPTDEVHVDESTTGEVGAFIARFEITQFQRRMTVAGRIVFEFIARGRLWCLKFYAMTDKKTKALGPWAMSISIMNPSPPTWLDSRVVITPPRGKSLNILPPWPLPKGSAVGSLLSSSTPDLRRDQPPIQFRLQTKTHQLESPVPTTIRMRRRELGARFAENPASSGLQYPYGCFYLPHEYSIYLPLDFFPFSDSAYYSRDGSLQVTMEARLARPSTEADCIIC